MQGALAGGLALGAGIATYYGIAVVRGYVVGGPTLAWTAVAAAAGPVMGLAEPSSPRAVRRDES